MPKHSIVLWWLDCLCVSNKSRLYLNEANVQCASTYGTLGGGVSRMDRLGARVLLSFVSKMSFGSLLPLRDFSAMKPARVHPLPQPQATKGSEFWRLTCERDVFLAVVAPTRDQSQSSVPRRQHHRSLYSHQQIHERLSAAIVIASSATLPPSPPIRV